MRACARACMRACVRVRACACARVRACVRACVRVCARVCACARPRHIQTSKMRAAFGGMAAGSWLFGSIATTHGPAVALLVAAAIQLFGIAAGVVLPLSAISQLDLTPRDGWLEPQTAIPVEARSGPIVVTVEHRVAQADIAAFLAVMSERRRIRRRDGARHWVLLRDLGEPTLWVERYHFPTWLDYVRHNERRTIADQANSEALHALWIDGIPPVVHRRIERQTGSLPHARLPDARELDTVTDPSRSS